MPISEIPAFDIIRVVTAILILVIGSISDWKTRTAEDWLWKVLGLLGIGLLSTEMFLGNWDPLSYIGIVLLFLAFMDIFWERKPIYNKEKKEVGWPSITVLLMGITLLAYFLISPVPNNQKMILLSTLGMVYLAYLFYVINIIHGGADAKALMVLAMLFPLYPKIFSMPFLSSPELVETAFPFAFLILFNAALASLAVPVALLFYNMKNRDISIPRALLGIKKDITTDPGFCWPMEHVKDDKVVISYFPQKGTDTETAFQELRDAGRTEAWVTPKIPFLIPMLVGLIISVILGNILSLMF